MSGTLKERLIRMIETGGPIPLSTYMQIALHDPQHGYYATRPGLGVDFITAPEISQIFGELIGVWIVNEWQAIGRPETITLAEIGPGRGTLMSDALRIASVAGGPALMDAMNLVLVEPSPALRTIQSEVLAPYSPSFAATLSELPDGPAIIVGNEYLDCLPARQFRKSGPDWHECVIGMNPERQLVFGLAAEAHDAPDEAGAEMIEVQPALDLLIADLAGRQSSRAPFRALFIDYGPETDAPGDSLRSFRSGEQVHPLDAPGETDLTVDVDFGRLGRLASKAGLDVAGPTPQGMFLLGLGAQARLNQLVKANQDRGEEIFNAAQSLIDPAQMGARFKAICFSSEGLPRPAGFGA